jgi:hypothetical protein
VEWITDDPDIVGLPELELEPFRRGAGEKGSRKRDYVGNRAALKCTEESGDDPASDCRSSSSSGGEKGATRGEYIGIHTPLGLADTLGIADIGKLENEEDHPP